MSMPLLIAIGAALAIAVVVLLLARRKAHPEPPPATRRAAAPAASAPQAGRDGLDNTDHGHRPHGSGIEVDELYVGEDDLFSTSERHIGDTQPVDRASLSTPVARAKRPSDADGGQTVASANPGGRRR